MLTILRALLIVGTPALLWLGWIVAPEVISPANMQFLGGVFAIVWGLSFYFVQKSADLANLPGLSSREHERLICRLETIRERVWWVGVISLVCVVLVWLLGSIPNVSPSWVTPVAIGFLVGVGLSYLAVIPGWLNELHGFVEKIGLRERKKARANAALLQLDNGKKNGVSHDNRAAT